MAEDDEIDILGDFDIDNIMSKSDSCLLVSGNNELLNCDYTIHPQWLLDKPSANPDNWYDSEVIAPDQAESMGHVSTENCITDESGWTEKEKNLLDHGIEIFGKSNVRLSQFIGSKTASEVKYYLKNFYSDNQPSRRYSECLVEDNNLMSDILDDTQIPASIEEVIAAVSTAKPTVATGGKKARKKSNSFSDININDIPSGQSLLKSNYIQSKQATVKLKKKPVKFKFKTKIKMQVPKEKITKIGITTGKGLSVPISEGEEIIKLKYVEDETDEDVDIVDSDSEASPIEKPPTVEKKPKADIPIESHNDLHSKQFLDLSLFNDNTVKQLMSVDEPLKEINLEPDQVTDLEKAVHNEYFEGRSTKTPERYLKIRNHIVNTWKNGKPTYVTKTSIRQGLKSCGDVNCIGRIHYFLEQIGAINFGCSQTTYSRPLHNMLQVTPTKPKTIKELNKESTRSNELGSRPRMKRKFNTDGEGGCTLTHDENGAVINTTIVNEDPVIKQKLHPKKPMIRLIYCRPFNEDRPQEYTINLQLSALLKMDFHAHTNLSEVMGMVAGYWSPQNKILTITHYEACKEMASSSTHCDMCPISQANAAEIIHNKGLDILGWFHSHPTFAPEPSQQDLETQQSLQKWIGAQRPCIGLILSPFSSNGALIASPYRCMIVDKKINFEDQYVPYKFQVNLLSEELVVEDFLKEIKNVMRFVMSSATDSKVLMGKPYFQDNSISYLEKFIYSVRMHLAKCGNISKMMCDKIIQGLTDVISNHEFIY